MIEGSIVNKSATLWPQEPASEVTSRRHIYHPQTKVMFLLMFVCSQGTGVSASRDRRLPLKGALPTGGGGWGVGTDPPGPEKRVVCTLLECFLVSHILTVGRVPARCWWPVYRSLSLRAALPVLSDTLRSDTENINQLHFIQTTIKRHKTMSFILCLLNSKEFSQNTCQTRMEGSNCNGSF